MVPDKQIKKKTEAQSQPRLGASFSIDIEYETHTGQITFTTVKVSTWSSGLQRNQNSRLWLATGRRKPTATEWEKTE